MAKASLQRDIEISSFNIKWFGLGGEKSGTPADEFRFPWIREFLDEFSKRSQVILFQEITDVPGLRDLLGADWQTVVAGPVYAPSDKHHHVVLALRDGLQLLPPPPEHGSDKDRRDRTELEFEKNKFGRRLTSGLRGILADRDGKHIAYLVGLHLKGGRGVKNSDLRVAQARHVASHLETLNSMDLPLLVLGDFNTWPANDVEYATDSNGKTRPDVDLLDDEFSDLGLKRVANAFPMTFRHLGLQLKLDHFWISDVKLVARSVDVCAMCKERDGYIAHSTRKRFRKVERFDDFEFYNRYVSDHSPIRASFRFPAIAAQATARLASRGRILMVLTSHDRLGDGPDKTGVWLEEVAAPYLEFTASGYDVDIASIAGGEPPIDPKSLRPSRNEESNRIVDKFQHHQAGQDKFSATISIANANASDYCAVVLPGGHGTMWDFAPNLHLRRIIEDVYRAGDVVGALCHGVAGLVGPLSAGGKPLVSGRNVTSYSNEEEQGLLDRGVVLPFILQDELQNLGGNYSSTSKFRPHVVEDGRLVTGQNPQSSTLFAKAVLRALENQSS